jgi:hypothetical protein
MQALLRVIVDLPALSVQLAAEEERAVGNTAHLDRGNRRQHENPEKIAKCRGAQNG